MAKKSSKKPAQPTVQRVHAANAANYPRHSSVNAIRIPKAILDQNAGRECTDTQAAGFLGLSTAKGPFAVEISSGIKYGFLRRPSTGKLDVTDLARQVLRPKSPDDVIAGYQEAVRNAPGISDVYLHYRGENLPDRQFFDNALEDTFGIPKDKLSEFKDIFKQCLESASLAHENEGRIRILHSATDSEAPAASDERIQKISADVGVARRYPGHHPGRR